MHGVCDNINVQSLVHYLAGWAIPIDWLVISDDLLAHEAALEWDKNTSERLLEREMDEQSLKWRQSSEIIGCLSPSTVYTPHSHIYNT